jgi:hypothetical protein
MVHFTGDLLVTLSLVRIYPVGWLYISSRCHYIAGAVNGVPVGFVRQVWNLT